MRRETGEPGGRGRPPLRFRLGAVHMRAAGVVRPYSAPGSPFQIKSPFGFDLVFCYAVRRFGIPLPCRAYPVSNQHRRERYGL